MRRAPGVPSGSRSNPWLDLVRSIAILLVLFRHGQRALDTEHGDTIGAIETLFINGWVGVDLFFILSGYLIARHLQRAGIHTGNFRFRRYLAMRALRIAPAYIAVLLLIVAGIFPLYDLSRELLGLRIAYHMLFLQDYLPSNINVVFWSLGVEEKFYLIAPLLLLLLARSTATRRWSLLLCLVFILPFAIRLFVYARAGADLDYAQFWSTYRSPFHMSVEGLLMGVAIATLENASLISRNRKGGMILLAGGGLMLATWLAAANFMARISAHDIFLQPLLINLLAAAMVAGAVQLADTPMLMAKPFNLLARLSYSLYLIHFPLIPMVLPFAREQGIASFWAMYFAASVGAALLLHLSVERPFLLWKDRLSGRNRQAELAMPGLA